MIKFLFSILLQSSAGFGAPVIPFPPSPNERALQTAKEYLLEPSAYQSVLLSRQIEELQPKGLVYVDSILKMITADERPWEAYHEKRAWLLEHLRSVVNHSDQWIAFDRSTLKKSIHQNAQKLLLQFPNPTHYQTNVLFLYNALKLWDETDLPFIAKKFIRDRSYAPLMVLYFSKGDPEVQKKFAAQVRRNKRYEFIETALLYQTHLLRDKELIYLFYRLLDDAYFGKLAAAPMFEFYEDEGRLLEQFKMKLILHLHQRLHEGDALILSIYHDLRENPHAGRPNPTDEQKEAYREFLQLLWTGKFPGECLFQLLP